MPLDGVGMMDLERAPVRIGGKTMEKNLWAVKHGLDRIEITVTMGPVHMAEAKCVGRSLSRRAPLWVRSETANRYDNRYSIVDHVSHVLLVCEAERPRKLDQLEAGLCGGQGAQLGFDLE
jgi:hypothetical protein